MPSVQGDSFVLRLARRTVSITMIVLGFLLLPGAGPLLLPVCVLIDVVRRSRFALARAYLVMAIYLTCEISGIVASGVLWFLPRDESWLERHYALQRWWARTLFRTIARLYDIRVDVQGLEHLEQGPYILLSRHVSVADTLVPATFVSARFGIRLRYVLKRELLWDPCLDIVGLRLPNAFVRRGSEDTEGAIATVERLVDGLGEKDGIMLYPEGTRFSEEKRASILNGLERKRDPHVERARALGRLLPPRLGGVLRLLEKAPNADVVVCAHVGFEGTRRLSDFYNGAMIGRRIQIWFQRFGHGSLPDSKAARVAWLYDRWADIDAWIANREQGA